VLWVVGRNALQAVRLIRRSNKMNRFFIFLLILDTIGFDKDTNLSQKLKAQSQKPGSFNF
jgi:hypothetical protein